MNARQRTTVEIVEEEFAKLGMKRIPAGYTPPKRKTRPKAAKPSDNGAKR